MHINPYLNFDGRCAGAMKFYEQALGAKVLFQMTWGEAPMAGEMPPETHNLIMHSTLAIGDGQIMCADSPPGRYQKPAGMSVSLHVKDATEGERVFKALSENGEVTMPYQQTFWARGFGMCVDQFGIPWMVNCEPEPQ
jgi:PhnB protein